MRIAAIDIGTNSVHMIVVRVRPDLSFEVIDREKVMVRLGAGGLDGKALTSDSMTAALQAVSKFKRLADSHGVDKVLAAATSATREARNGGEFLAQVERQTGVRPRVITGAEEAHLIHQAAVYGVDPNLSRSQWFDLITTAKQGGTIDAAAGGKITHVQDVADALTLAVGDEQVAGQFYNLVDRYMYWQRAAEFAKELTGSTATIVNRAGGGPKNQFDCTKAIDFFTRHGNTTALRRGEPGVRKYVAELLTAAGSPG